MTDFNPEKHYMGAPCKRGHDGVRYRANNTCVGCSSKQLAEWRVLNRDRYKQICDEYNQRNAERLRHQTRGWRARNLEYARERARQYAAANTTKRAAIQRNRTAQKMRAVPSWLTADDHWLIQEIYDLCAERTRVTGVEHHVDHIVPLQGRNVRGLHVPWNLQILTAAENTAKGNRLLASQ